MFHIIFKQKQYNYNYCNDYNNNYNYNNDYNNCNYVYCQNNYL